MRAPRPRGVRTRLLLVVVVSVAAVLAVMTVAFNVLLAHSLSHDATAVARSRAAAESVSLDMHNGRLAAPEAPADVGMESQSWVFAGGKVIERPRVNGTIDAAAKEVSATPGVAVNVPGQHTRLYAMPAIMDGKRVGVVVAGVSLTPYEATQRLALIGSILLAIFAVLAVTLIARWMLTAALRPVARMTADAEAWSLNEPGRRFAVGEPYDELSQLAATLDRLLDRLAASLRREELFSAELSHELRTPLAGICAEAELALRRDREPAAYREALATVLSSAQQMSRMVDTLVLAARQESTPSRGRTDATEVLDRVAATFTHVADERSLTIDVAPGPGVWVGVDDDVAARIVQPLVENACRHARREVRLRVRRAGAVVEVMVDDDGPGVDAAEIERIFEPGVRGAADVENGAPGAGLGLALARRLARAAGGEVEAEASGDGGRFVARLPAG
jgi:signal transduction histidine kinase